MSMILSGKFISSRMISFYSPAISFGVLTFLAVPKSSKLTASFGIMSTKASNI